MPRCVLCEVSKGEEFVHWHLSPTDPESAPGVFIPVVCRCCLSTVPDASETPPQQGEGLLGCAFGKSLKEQQLGGPCRVTYHDGRCGQHRARPHSSHREMVLRSEVAQRGVSQTLLPTFSLPWLLLFLDF